MRDLTIQPPLSLREIRSKAHEVSQPKTVTKIVIPPPFPMITRSQARELARTERLSYVFEPSTVSYHQFIRLMLFIRASTSH